MADEVDRGAGQAAADGRAGTRIRPRRLAWTSAPPPALAALALAAEAARDRLADTLRRELDRGAGFAWAVVAFAAGAGLYLALPREPWLPALAVTAVATAVLAVGLRRRGRDAHAVVMAAMAAAGLLAGKLESDRVAAPRLDRERTVSITGWVEEAEASRTGGTRMTVRVTALETRGRDPPETPARIVATAAKGRDGGIAIGSGVTFLARLRPPDGPVLPGSYDFARRAWFDGRGAAGFVLGRVRPADLGAPPLDLALSAGIARFRHDVAERIRATLPGAAGAVAAALMVGEARAIPDDVNEALRTAGLSHVISISGLHMTLVGGTVLAVVRLILAAIPGLALRFPIRKWAAVAAFAAVTGYLLVSGGGVATNRSYVMFSVALLAVLTDRPAVGLRTVALSALLILAVQPHAVAEPSFLMSFLAVGALVAAYAGWRERPLDPAERALRAAERSGAADGFATHLARLAGRYAAGLAVSSVVAGAATAPVVAAEFFRAAPYGLLANMIALPIIGTLVMPAALVTALAMPFGLEAWPLAVMGLGIDLMNGVAAWIAGLPGGAGLIGRIHPWSLPLAVAGILWTTLWSERWRWAGALPLAAALALAPWAVRPAVLVSADGETVAVRAADGRLAILGAAKARFTAAVWLAADADPRTAAEAGLDAGWRCDPLGCAFDAAIRGADAAKALPDAAEPGVVDTDPPAQTGTPSGAMPATRRIVAVVRDPLAFDEDCRLAAVVITRLAVPPGCAAAGAVVLDAGRLARTGTVTGTWTAPESLREGGAATAPPVAIAAALPAVARPWTAGPRPAPPAAAPAAATPGVIPKSATPAAANGEAKPAVRSGPSAPAATVPPPQSAPLDEAEPAGIGPPPTRLPPDPTEEDQ